MSLILFIGALHQVRAPESQPELMAINLASWPRRVRGTSYFLTSVNQLAPWAPQLARDDGMWAIAGILRNAKKNLKKYQLGVDGLSVAT